MRAADHGEDGEGLERAAWNKDALGVGAEVRGIQKKSLGDLLREIIRHEPFDNFSVLKLEAYPQTLGARTAGEGFAQQRFGVTELAHKVDALDVLQIGEGNAGTGIAARMRLSSAMPPLRSMISTRIAKASFSRSTTFAGALSDSSNPGGGLVRNLHKLSFIVLFATLSVHVLGHLRKLLSGRSFGSVQLDGSQYTGLAEPQGSDYANVVRLDRSEYTEVR